MIGLDTNLLVRYITQDHPEQAAQATRLIETRCSRANPGRVTQIVLCELVWVLRRAYGYSKQQVVEVLDQILLTSEFAIENEEIAFQALEAYLHGKADFADYLLVVGNHEAGCKTTYTFDERLCAHPNASFPE